MGVETKVSVETEPVTELETKILEEVESDTQEQESISFKVLAIGGV